MTCQEHWETLSAALDNEPIPGKRAAAERHLASCPECQERQAAAQTLRTGLLAAAHSRAADPIRDEAILAALRSEGWRLQTPSAQGCEGTEARGGRHGLPWPFSFLPPWWRRDGTLNTLAPALVVLAAAFLLTWAPLHMAESGKLSGPNMAAVPTSRPMPAGAVPGLTDWLRQPALVAAILQGQPLRTGELLPPGAPFSPPAPPEPRKRQGTLPRNNRPVG
jgi:anti-sigma factor RsiW